MDKPTLSRILSILLTAAIALAATFGYNIAIVQPQLATLTNTPHAATRGVTNLNELQADTITATGDLTVGDAANIGGALSAASVASSGAITGAGLHVTDAVGTGLVLDSPYGQITIGDSQGTNTGGYLLVDGSNDPAVMYVRSMAFQPQKLSVTAKTGNHSLDTVSDMGGWFSNLGASGAVTFSLPTATAGSNVCFYVAAAQTVYIDPAGANQILALTNAAGDRISNGTQGSAVCLLSLSSTQWGAMSVSGTWADAN